MKLRRPAPPHEHTWTLVDSWLGVPFKTCLLFHCTGCTGPDSYTTKVLEGRWTMADLGQQAKPTLAGVFSKAGR